jgi:hypothetical protein
MDSMVQPVLGQPFSSCCQSAHLSFGYFLLYAFRESGDKGNGSREKLYPEGLLVKPDTECPLLRPDPDAFGCSQVANVRITANGLRGDFGVQVQATREGKGMDRAVLPGISISVFVSGSQSLYLTQWIRWLGTNLGSHNYHMCARCRSFLGAIHCMHAEKWR